MSSTIGSLFSGIGGLELGLERAGLGPVLWQAESSPYCRSILADHWPDARRFPDVRSIRAGRVPVPDVVCGGFPCQDISAAGTGRGLDGERSGLWSEYARVIRDLRPRVVVVQNSPRLRGLGLGRVLGDLAACGYDATWDCVPASALGAPHRRDRIFVVAWRVPDPDGDAVRVESERGEDPASSAEHGGDAESRDMGALWRAALADTTRERQAHGESELQPEGQHGGGSETQRLERPGRASGDEPDGCDLPQWPPGPDDVSAWSGVPRRAQPALCPLADGLPSGVARPALRAVGNAVAVPVGEVIGRLVRALLEGGLVAA